MVVVAAPDIASTKAVGIDDPADESREIGHDVCNLEDPVQGTATADSVHSDKDRDSHRVLETVHEEQGHIEA